MPCHLAVQPLNAPTGVLGRIQSSNSTWSTLLHLPLHPLTHTLPPDPTTPSDSTLSHLQVLLHGMPLLSSTGEEYQGLENDPDFQKMSMQVSRQGGKEGREEGERRELGREGGSK